MLRRFRSHFRHNVVAYIALFFALSGTAIAAKQYTGADIQDGSLTGVDVSDESTLKGLDIDESDLGKVPSAASADTAANADSADNAANADLLDGKDSTELGGGATTFEVAISPQGVDHQTVATLDNGVTISAGSCDPGGQDNPQDMELGLNPTSPEDGFLQVSGHHMLMGDTGFPIEDIGLFRRDSSSTSSPEPALSFGGLFFISFHGIVRTLSNENDEAVPGSWARIDVAARPGFPAGKCSVSGVVTPYG